MPTVIKVPFPPDAVSEGTKEKELKKGNECCAAFGKWLMDYHLPIGLVLITLLGYLWPTPGMVPSL